MKAYWLLEDTLNYKLEGYPHVLKNNNIKILKIISSNPGKNLWGINQQKIEKNEFGAANLMLKLCFLISKTANSNTDKEFPKRNVYSLPFISGGINFFWSLKLKFFNRFLLSYSDTLMRLRGKRNFYKCSQLLNGVDAIVVDSLWVRNADFLDLIFFSKKMGLR